MFSISARKLLRILLFGSGALVLTTVGALVGTYFYFASSLPLVETLGDYRPPIVTTVYSDDNEVIAEIYRERRIVVPVNRMPQQLIQAFVAAEDTKFFEHQGIDLISILRAAMKNIKAGGIVQGGSTITQQVAKSLLLTPEKKFSRKIKEAILAWRMERALTKDEILHLYLNQIYLGHGAHGVQAAAENYFRKDVSELTLPECALLAGLPQAPSRYSPYSHMDRAKNRQRYALDRMVAEEYVTADEADEAFAEELTIHPRPNVHRAETAYFTEQVRRYLKKAYGEELLYNGGLQVHTTMDLNMQKAALKAVQENLHDHDKRQGYRGPDKILSPDAVDDFLAGKQEKNSGEGEIPEVGSLIEGVLTSGPASRMTIRIGPELSGILTVDGDHWAAPLSVVPSGKPATGNADAGATRLPIGSVLLVKVTGQAEDGTMRLALEQIPETQGALLALDPREGRVKAMIGGYDFARNQFNRAIQARRLPGSAIKPVIYAAALDKGYTPASVILDTPIIYKETDLTGEEQSWKPRNYGKRFHGPTPFRAALTKSHNVITIKILEDIGIGYATNYARKLGITSPITRDLTLALGSSALTPLELATAYTVFASGGVRVTPTFITRVADRDGRVLESIDPTDFPGGPGEGQRLIRQSPQRVISPETAYLITNMMESVVQRGTGWRAKALGRPVAAKTGTTNDLKDAWFAGFVPQLVAVSWVGYDQERPLGNKETGSRAAAPAWVDFMQEAVSDYEPLDFSVPDNIEFHPVDRETGLLAPEDGGDVYIEAFAPGTAPTRYAIDEKQLQARDFFKLDLEEN